MVRKIKALLLVFSISCILGIAAISTSNLSVVATQPTFELTIPGTITEYYNEPEWTPEAVVVFDLPEDWTRIELSWEPYGDLDAILFDSDFQDVAWLMTWAEPEHAYFYATGGTYYLLINWWEYQGIEPPEQIDYVVHVESPAENPRSNGGANSFTACPRQAYWWSDNLKPSHRDPIYYDWRIINMWSTLPGHNRFNAEEAFSVGLFTIGTGPTMSWQEFLDFRDANEVFHWIDGIPLEDLTHIRIGPAHKHHFHGYLLGYYWRVESGTFVKGELAELIGLGIHTYHMEWYQDGELHRSHTGTFELI
jgi:hypothetical protein